MWFVLELGLLIRGYFACLGAQRSSALAAEAVCRVVGGFAPRAYDRERLAALAAEASA
jgi:hypothetical protein